MSDNALNNVIGGKLKLKGKALALAPAIDKKKKKRTKRYSWIHWILQTNGLNRRKGKEPILNSTDTTENDQIILPDDPRTKAEKRHDEMNVKRQAQMIKEAAKSSHRERMEEYNKFLAEKVGDHFDIPKVQSAGLG